LSFSQSSVTDIGMTTDGTTDIITIDLNDIPRPNTSFLTNPRRFIVDLPGTSMDRLVDDAQSGGFVSHLQSTQHSPTAGRVVLSFSQAASVQTEVVGNSVVLTVTAPTYRNISYNHQTRTITISKAGMQINPSAITRQDEYHHLRYTLRMGYNLADHLGHGNFHINDDFIDYVNISTDTAGQTSLVISQRRVLAYTVTESAENIYIQARLPREIYSHIVVLDPGHGGSDNGAMRDGITEKYLNLVISQMLADIARQSGYIKVYTTRNDDTFVSLAERARFANEVGDLFVSIHHNAVRLGGNTAANGYETHYWTRPSADPHAITSHQAAHIMHRNVLNATGSNDREVRQSQFVVLTQTNIPAIFLEIGFMSNPAELQRMTDPVHQQRTAEGIYAGLREIFSVYAPRR
ncbi:MAG: N-acetylmuramoyl-L-alanine amidase, partial [Defluviitaleaceae bacterium]|nr:N-acetylmuramoyl-L-alanine amidase [Defluviitaleaceae bacterium]